jgi:beta-glucosidase
VAGHSVTVAFTVKNTGKRAGKEIAEVYATLPASTGEPPKRLIGWQKVQLAAGESKPVNITVDPLYLSIFNEGKNSFEVAGGAYKIWAGGSSRNLPLSQAVQIGN